MRAWYLADPEQECSVAILEGELGFTVRPGSKGGDAVVEDLAFVEEVEVSEEHLGAAFADTVQELAREHRWAEAGGQQAWVVTDGRVLIDVRDSGDAWVRVSLGKGEGIRLPNGVWRRMVLPTADPFVMLHRFNAPVHNGANGNGSGSGGDEKLMQRFLREYRYASQADELRMSALLQDQLQSQQGPAAAEHGDTRQLIVELCRQFYDLGWVTGTGGSISIRQGNRVFMTPSGVQKERMLPEELYVLDMSGNQLHVPLVRPGRAKLKLTACAPLFFHSYRIRDAGAVIHSHGMECVLATLLAGEGAREFRITHQEMIKGIAGHGYRSELVIPIIENTPHEADLADSLGEAIRAYPDATAVLVRRHGIYIWGATWMQAKTQAECYHYLFKLAVEMHRLGVDYTKVPEPTAALEAEAARLSSAAASSSCCSSSGGGHMHGHGGGQGQEQEQGKKEGCISHVLMDIEGTTTSISFVHDTLFPYASQAVEGHLRAHLKEPETQADIQALWAQAAADAEASMPGVPPIGPAASYSSDDALIAAVVANVKWQMAQDRKTTALKQLQGHIWAAGYDSGALRSHVYPDVPPAFERWAQRGLKMAIYSSGSRAAQRLLFQHTEAAGDLRNHLACYFDTTVGGKREEGSYAQIALSLGVTHPAEILFLTDVVEEAVAARAAGLRVVLSVRPGNKPLDPALAKGMLTVTSFDQVDAIIDAAKPLAASGTEQ